MKTKRILIAVLTAALFTALIIGCNVPPEDTILDIVKGGGEPAPDGKVKVRLNVTNSESNARTILPNTGLYTNVDDFPAFFLIVLDDSDVEEDLSSQPPFDNWFAYSGFADTLVLTPGDYTFILIANDTVNGGGKNVAWGITDSLVTIVGDNTDVVTIELKGIVSDIPTALDSYVDAGTFIWDLSAHSSTYETALLTLTPISSVTPVTRLDALDLLYDDDPPNEDYINISDSLEIPFGYYTLVLELGKDGFQTVYVRDIVHIYSGLETTYAPATLPTLRSTRHTVTFDYGTDSTNAGTPTKSADHGDVFSDVLVKSPDNTTPVHSTDSANYYFDGWYTNGGLSTALVGTDLVLKPTTLYAKWTEKGIPTASGYTITNLTQYDDDTIVAVSIVPKATYGSVSTIHYVSNDGGGYNSTAFPTAVGTYDVTFDVAVADKWKVQAGLDAGELEIIEVPTPVASDFTVTKLTQTENRVVAVSIEPDDFTIGSITKVLYVGDGVGGNSYNSTVVPQDVGGYYVEITTSAVSHTWKAAVDLIVGKLVVEEPQYFNISLVWDSGTAPIFNTGTSEVSYDPINDELTINIYLTNAGAFSSFGWFADFSYTSLGTNAALEIVISNVSTTNNIWSVPGPFTFTLWADTNSGTINFTPRP